MSISRDSRWLALWKLHTMSDSDIHIADLKAGTQPKPITASEAYLRFLNRYMPLR